MLTLILVPVQLLLTAFAMRGFQQQWNTEIEVSREEADRYGPDARGGSPERRSAGRSAPRRSMPSPGCWNCRQDGLKMHFRREACGFDPTPGILPQVGGPE